MVVCALLGAVLFTAEPAGKGAAVAADPEDLAEEPEGGAGVSPIELVPRVELRQSYLNLGGGLAVHDSILETDIQFLHRVLIRYQLPYRVLHAPTGQLSGAGDIQLEALGIVRSDPSALVGVIVGAVLDTATQPQLGQGKQQIVFGGGAAFKPRPFWLPYLVVKEQLSVGGDAARASVNQLDAQLGNILFGKRYNWLKVDLDASFDFAGDRTRGFGTLEIGSLLIGRVGLFLRTGTQLFGDRQLDYSLAAGFRYLFRLERSHARPP